MSSSTRLSILHVSDVHAGFKRIEALTKWLKDNGEKVDVIFLSGDVADMPMAYGSDTSDEAVLFKGSYLEDYKTVVEMISTISDNIYSIPGNHDVPSLFDSDAGGVPSNIHRQCRPVAPNLFVAGFGGSMPGYYGNGEKVWEGFPFQTQDEVTKELDQFLPPLFSSETTPLKHPNDRLVLMTHCGPNESSTTVSRSNPLQPIYSGSTGLDNWMARSEIQSKVIMNLHGHTHPSFGETQVGGITVLNSGSLLEGRFALYSLCRPTVDNQPWRIESTRFYSL